MKSIVQGVLQTRHTRVNIKTIRDFQGLQTMDPPGLPAQDISHATSINSLNTYVANIMVRKTEMFVHRPIPSFTDGTFVVVEPGPQPSHSLPHVLHIAFSTNDCVNDTAGVAVQLVSQSKLRSCLTAGHSGSLHTMESTDQASALTTMHVTHCLGRGQRTWCANGTSVLTRRSRRRRR